MPTINTFDRVDSAYMSEIPGGVFGSRMHYDRRYWLAWATTESGSKPDCNPGVMDDFGTLVPVPYPSHQPLH